MGGVGKTKIDGIEACIYTNLEDISMQGSLGDPFASTAEIGKVYFDRMVECGIKFVEKMQASDMHIKNVKLWMEFWICGILKEAGVKKMRI